MPKPRPVHITDNRTPDLDRSIEHYCIPHVIHDSGEITCKCAEVTALRQKHDVHRIIPTTQGAN